MPRMVTELTQGNTFSLNADRSAWSAKREWKVLVDANESWNINDAIGVNIGDIYNSENPLPCVSIESRHDGESRLVAIVTATYRANAGGGTEPANQEEADPLSISPIARKATYSMSTSLSEIAAWGGRVVTGGVSGEWLPAQNPVGDLIDGISRLEPILTITFEQYSYSDMSSLVNLIGYVNSNAFQFSAVSIGPHCCMFQGFSVATVVEQFGRLTFRGFKVSYTFVARGHYTLTRNGPETIGWDVAIPQTGFNIINNGLNDQAVEQTALVLEHEDGKVKNPAALAVGTAGTKVRAMVTVASPGGGTMQRPASQPVALNDNGTPRSQSQTPKILINRVCTQPEMGFGTNFNAFGVRL